MDLIITKKPQEARRELSEGLRALDHGKEKRLPASGVVRALKRLGIELNMKERKAEHSLRVFEVRAASYMASYTVKATRVGAVSLIGVAVQVKDRAGAM